MSVLHEHSLDTLCAALAYALDVPAPQHAAAPNETLTNYVDQAFGGQKADRIFMYNPDAIATWVWEKYPHFLQEAAKLTELRLPLRSPMPSVTPVCFGTMYTGAQPEIHGIQSYRKPVITIDSLFDTLLRVGKKCAIVAYGKCSLRHIFCQREMDYYFWDTMDQATAQAAKLVTEDKHDFILVYNGSYDSLMHKYGPESPEALGELRANSRTFAMLHHLIRQCWGGHRTLMGFATDHGCHEIDGNCGSHGLDMPEDLNITHFYQAITGGNDQ